MARTLGLRAQILLALLAVLGLAGALAASAIRPLAVMQQREARRRVTIVLARAVAGQAIYVHDRDELASLLHDTVGPGAFTGVALLDSDGNRVVREGSLLHALPPLPFTDAVEVDPTRVTVVVSMPGRGALVAETALERTRAEEVVIRGVLLYTLVASVAALWAVFFILTRYTVRPMEALTGIVERVAAGRRDVVAEASGSAEVVRAATALNEMTRTLAMQERELIRRVDDLETATRELQTAQESLVRSERLAVVGRLSAGIAHEVGNPLAAIVGLTEVLRDGGLDEAEVQDFASRIGNEAQRIHRTVRELLDYARAAPRTSDTGTEAGDVGDAVVQVVRLLAPQRSMRGIELTTRVAGDLAHVALGTDRLVQVLLNLVLNAADAIHGARGDEATGAIAVSATHADGRVQLTVQDDGPGIAHDVRGAVFEPFYTTKPAGQGTGLGLAICTVIVEQAGGTITVHDRLDGAPGARFVIELATV